MASVQPVTRNVQYPVDIVKSTLTVGMLSGTTGLLFGSIIGIIRSAHPVIFAVACGCQWFALGTTFWGSRSVLLTNWDNDRASASPRLYASGIAGAMTGGTVAALTRGRANILPGMGVFGLCGFCCQALYNTADTSHPAPLATVDQPSGSSFLQKLASKTWVPMQSLTDAEYTDWLQKRLLRVEAEIATIDENIAQLQTTAKYCKE